MPSKGLGRARFVLQVQTSPGLLVELAPTHYQVSGEDDPKQRISAASVIEGGLGLKCRSSDLIRQLGSNSRRVGRDSERKLDLGADGYRLRRLLRSPPQFLYLCRIGTPSRKNLTKSW
jgi:hypothetical protein